MHFPPELALERPPPGWRPRALGTGAEVRAAFARALPGCRYEGGELHYAGPGYTITALVDEADSSQVMGVTVMISKDGGDPMPDVLALAAALDAGAMSGAQAA